MPSQQLRIEPLKLLGNNLMWRDIRTCKKPGGGYWLSISLRLTLGSMMTLTLDISRLRRIYQGMSSLSMLARGAFGALMALVPTLSAEESPVADSLAPVPDHVVSKSLLPIAMYDSDIGFGFGGKAVLKNLKSGKSYDLVIFGSTRGEQWYAFTYSSLDPTLRRDSVYALALDLSIEYDKLLKSNFFGIGNNTEDNEDQFPREIFRFKGKASHAFSRDLAGLLSIRLAQMSAYGYEPAWPSRIAYMPGVGESQLLALESGAEYDTRDDVIDPGRGVRIALTAERAAKFADFDWDFWKGRLENSAYLTVLGKGNVLAARLWLQEVSSGAPFQELSNIGDGWTARGYKAGRFLDRAMALASLEYRFPIYKRLCGVAFVDAGRVWRALDDFGFDDWHRNWGGGLRYRLANFVGRLDIGRSPEGMRIFFNFGHVF